MSIQKEIKNSMMKLTLLGPTYPYRGGISQHTTLLCHYLRDFHLVEFISFQRQYPTLLFPGKTDKDPSRLFDRESCTYQLDPLNPMTWYQTVKTIMKINPVILIIIWWVPFFAPAWWFITQEIKKRSNIRILFVCHNVLPHEGHIIWKFLTHKTLSIPHGFIVHSVTDKEKLLQIRSDARIYHLPIAPHPRIRPHTTDKSLFIRKLGIKNGIPIFLFFGFIRPYKGLDILLEALFLVLKKRLVHLVVAGEFWEPVEKYMKIIHRLDLTKHVTIINQYIPNESLGDYFNIANIVVLPYRDATQSGVPQLAVSMGKLIIVSDAGGLPENVKHSQIGKIFRSGDIHDLAKVMIEFISQKKNQENPKNNSLCNGIPDGWKEMISVIEDFSKSSTHD